MGGQVYDILIERRGGSWSVTVFQMPRMLGVESPDLQGSFPDFASAERAVREFIRSRP